MNNNAIIMKQALYSLEDSLKQLGREVKVEEIAGIVENHAIATGLSAGAAGAIPGAGGTVAFGVSCASTVTMYGRLAKTMGVRLNNGMIKAIASAVVADLAASVTATVFATAAVSFIPGVGNMASATLTAITNFGFVYIAGIIFIKMVAALGVSKVENMTEESLKSEAKKVRNGMNIKSVMKEAKSVFKKNRKK